jgi:hypothetical protein
MYMETRELECNTDSQLMMDPELEAQTPPFATVSHAPLIDLPAELLHEIFSRLSLEDVLAARKTCSTLAAIGVDHFGDEMPLVYHRDKFSALKNIAQHESLSKRMRSLFYIVDRFECLCYEEWVDRMSRTTNELSIADEHSPGVIDVGDEMIETRARQIRAATLAAGHDIKLRKGYKAFLEICRDQDKIDGEGYDFQHLRYFFEGCSNIREVTIVSKVNCQRRLNAEYTAFEKTTMLCPWKDKCWHDVGLDQVGALAHAVWHSRLKLDSLTLAGISHAIFLTRTERGKLLSRALRVLIRPLRRLRLYIQAWAPADEKLGVSDESSDSDAEVIQSVRTDTSSIFEEGNFRKILNVAKELRVLKLEFPRRLSFDYGPSYAQLDLALPDMFFPHLYELELSQCSTDGTFLADLLLRHKTLRRLTLGDMEYTEIKSQWKTVLSKIGGQLPNLRKARIRGTLYTWERMPLFDERPESPERGALERFILKGGRWPLKAPWFAPSDESPGSESDDDMSAVVSESSSEDDMPLDDPARQYMMDEFDDGCTHMHKFPGYY